MKLNNKVLKDFLVYAIQPLLSKLIVFALIPLYTQYLSTADYGNLEYVLTFGAFFSTFIDLGVSSSFWNYKSSKSAYSVETVVFNMLLLTLGLGVMAWIAYYFWWYFFAADKLLAYLIGVMLLSEVFKKAYDLAMMVYTSEFKSLRFLVGALIYAAVLVGSNLFFLLVLQLKIDGVIYSYLVTAVVVCLAYAVMLYRRSIWQPNLKLGKEMLAYGVPIMLGNLILVLITLSSRYFLKTFTSDSELGEFSYVYKWGTLAQVLLANSFYLAWNPIRWEIYERPDGREIFGRFNGVFMVFFPFLALLLMAVLYVFVPLVTFNDDFTTVMSLLPWVAMSFVLYSMYFFNTMGLLFMNKTRTIMYIMLASGVLNVVLNYLLIAYFRSSGAAYAMFLTFAFMLWMGRYFAEKHYPVPRNRTAEILQYVVLLLCTLLVYYLTSVYDNPLLQGLVTLLVAVVWLSTNLLFKFFRFSDLKEVLNRIKPGA